MKVIAQVKLDTTPEQADALKRTLEAANAAANYISDHAWDTKTFQQYDLHHACYYEVRERFNLSAQVTVRIIAKVADAYKLDRKRKRRFNPYGSIAYDKRILSWKLSEQTVNIWTMNGRQRIPFLAGQRQLELLQSLQGEADLIYRAGEFYLHQVCEIETPDPDDPEGWLGVDLGIVNIATTSDGEVFSGEQLESKRQWYAERRATLQSVGTKSAKRRLKQLSGRQSRFQTGTNHRISKALVETAQRTGRGIALEDLSGIRERTRVRRGQRNKQHNWPFYQLRQFVSYKAKLVGVSVQLVDPRYTSQGCSVCGHTDPSNRPTRDDFLCSGCGFAAPADLNAAINIAARAAVNRPMVSTEVTKDFVNCVTVRSQGQAIPL